MSFSPYSRRRRAVGIKNDEMVRCRDTFKFRVGVIMPIRQPFQSFLCILFIGLWVTQAVAKEDPAISTAADRKALFEAIIAKTMAREAFSEIKNKRLGSDIERDMRSFEAEVVGAKTQEELYFALIKMSNARRDRHLWVHLTDGGLEVDRYYTAGRAMTQEKRKRAPEIDVRFSVDFGRQNKPFLFVGDFAIRTTSKYGVAVGDRVISVNGRPFEQYVALVRPYYNYSTENGFWFMLAYRLSKMHSAVPRHFYQRHLELELERRSGETYTVSLPYRNPATIAWRGMGKRTFPGFKLIEKRKTFDLYRHRDRNVLLLVWHAFWDALVKDMNWLTTKARKKDWLEHDLIWDGTRSIGGSLGAFALQRLTPKPFKVTFGNVRISDVIPKFIDYKRNQFQRRRSRGHTVSETLDNGRWLMDWLNEDVTEAIQTGKAYSNQVPFKLAHLPKHSDGMLQPAPIHFRGKLVCLTSPYSGSHLDQFVAMVADNDLGPIIGMPSGGFSNTWEWSEVLHFPISGKPVAEFMWTIGHTIRPNGELLEGNPPAVDIYVPTTRDNYLAYYPDLLDRALAQLNESP